MPALPHIPVIMLTIVDDRTLGYSLGASEFMTKPIDRARLIELLRQFAPRRAKTRRADRRRRRRRARQCVKTTVERRGLKTAEADNGRDRARLARAHPPPALILLDLMMPVMDGFEFLEQVREDRDAGRACRSWC